MNVRTVTAAVLVAGCVAPSAHAAGWNRVTAPDGTSIEQVGLLRTGDGVLHVAWHHRTGPNTEDLLHTGISRDGVVGATKSIQSGWTGFTNPALVADPSGIRAFWGGLRSTDSNDPQKELSTALSTDGGATWALQPGSVVPTGGQAYGSPISATVLANGTTLQSWAGTLGTWVHSGLSAATPNHDYQGPIGQYGHDPALATDASDRTVMAWYSSAAGHLGVLAQDVAADGSPIGSAVTMPDTGNMAIGMLGRTPVVARRGGGFYVAYPTGSPSQNRIRVWRVGTGSAREIARVSGSGNQPVAVAAADEGRLWVAWVRNRGGVPEVFARRSNGDATVFGATVDAGQPPGSKAAYGLDASAVAGALDIIGNFSIGATSVTAAYHRRILPGLTLKASPRRLLKGDTRKVRFTVSDAGDAVSGATVKAGGRSGTTNGQGRAVLSLHGAGKAIKAVATHTGYSRAAVRLRVR
jgi:hypothetical protein